MSVEYKNNTKEFLSRFDRAREAGLVAASQVIINAVKRKLAHGYTSGAFLAGNVLNSVTSSTIVWAGGEATIRVGSTQTDPAYPLFWELGHYNLFTGKYERVEVWVPAMLENREKASAAYARTVKRYLGMSRTLIGGATSVGE